MQAGIPLSEDFNGPEQDGVGWYQVTQRDGMRCSTAVAYLHPVLERPNLEVRTDAYVTRVLLDGNQAIGVEVDQVGGLADIEHAAGHLGGRGEADPAHRQGGGFPCGHATGQFAGQLLVADAACLADQVGPVLAGLENEGGRLVRAGEPAKPGGEGRAQRDR